MAISAAQWSLCGSARLFLTARCVALVCSLGALVGTRADAQAGDVLMGRVVDEATSRPIRDVTVELRRADGTAFGPGFEAFTDAQGRFEFTGVPNGMHMVEVRHLAYGVRRHTVMVQGTGAAAVTIFLSATAIRLAPLMTEVEPAAPAVRAVRSSRTVALRDEIADAARGGTSLVEFIRRRFPGIQVRISGQIGMPTCVEFRQVDFRQQCRVPTVHLDGMATSSTSALQTLSSIPLIDVTRVEVIAPSFGAGGSYGLDGAWGAIVVETHAQADQGSSFGSAAPRTREFQPWYDWAPEPRPYLGTRVYAAAFAGNAVGLAAGLAAVAQCVDLEAGVLRTRETSLFGRRAYRCHPSVVLATGLLATVLPAVTGAVTARMAGATDRSSGAVVYSALASQAVFIPAAVIFITGTNGRAIGPGEVAGLALVTLGAPLLNALSDRFFRILR